MTMIKSLVGGIAVLALSLTLGTGIANAADTRPVKGTPACTNLVNGQSDVLLARGTVQVATANLNEALRAVPVVDSLVATDRQTLADAQAHLKVVVGNVTGSLCKNGPAETTTPPVVAGSDKDCADFSTQAAAQAYLAAHPSDKARLDDNNNGVACEAAFVEHSTTVVERPSTTVVNKVVPTVDDGSVATGTQVTVAPEGSASTGEA